MTHSLNEVEALARKAARGAGYDWGLAEEAGRVVRWLSRHGLPGAGALAMALQMREAVTLRAPGPDDFGAAGQGQGDARALCPVALGAAIADLGNLPEPCAFQSVAAPLLLLPQVACVAARSQGTLHLEAGGIKLWCNAKAAAISAKSPLKAQAAVLIGACYGAWTPGGFDASSRADVPKDTLDVLAAFAHRTYAPATEASRRAGAGAGEEAD